MIKLIKKRKYNFDTVEEQDSYFQELKQKYDSRWSLACKNGYLYELLAAHDLLDRYYPKKGMGRKRLTKEQVVDRIKKFKTRKQLTNTNTGLYYAARDFGVLDLYLPSAQIYTWKLTEQVFAVHSGGEIREIFNNYKGFYDKARNEGWIEELCKKYKIKNSKGLSYGI